MFVGNYSVNAIIKQDKKPYHPQTQKQHFKDDTVNHELKLLHITQVAPCRDDQPKIGYFMFSTAFFEPKFLTCSIPASLTDRRPYFFLSCPIGQTAVHLPQG